ncbi:MAG: hypothetical protein HYR96_08010 [Deltaproteobacteria bacterium]|nr:hypothetical protein [Deltaproteobacteria bacterium]MBI3293452.1 hypothetical protein [Deltaproteobacteria bacterium]
MKTAIVVLSLMAGTGFGKSLFCRMRVGPIEGKYYTLEKNFPNFEATSLEMTIGGYQFQGGIGATNAIQVDLDKAPFIQANPLARASVDPDNFEMWYRSSYDSESAGLECYAG